MDTKKTRKSYRTQQKLEVVNHAKKYGNVSAAKEFEADESNIRYKTRSKAIIRKETTM